MRYRLVRLHCLTSMLVQVVLFTIVYSFASKLSLHVVIKQNRSDCVFQIIIWLHWNSTKLMNVIKN